MERPLGNLVLTAVSLIGVGQQVRLSAALRFLLSLLQFFNRGVGWFLQERLFKCCSNVTFSSIALWEDVATGAKVCERPKDCQAGIGMP